MNGTIKTKVVKIRPLEGFNRMSDADIVHRGTAVVTGLTGNSNFTTLPVDLANSIPANSQDVIFMYSPLFEDL